METLTDPTLENLLSIIGGQMGKIGITPESTFTRLGCDSLDMIDLIMECESQFGISIEDEESAAISTVNDLYQIILGKFL